MNNKHERGARSFSINYATHFKQYCRHHGQECLRTLNALLCQPIASLMTLLVIAIALVLPTIFYLFLSNGQQVIDQWSSTTQVSAFLKLDTTQPQLLATQKKIGQIDSVAKVTVIKRSQAWQQFKQQSGLGESLDLLSNNPLPHTLIITPKDSATDKASVQQLVKQIKQLSQVEDVQLDQAWLSRLNAIIHLIKRITQALTLFLAIAVILTISNTIRLAIANKRAEIEIMKLVGATDGFVRRPYLYHGFWLGFIASLLAWLLVSLLLMWLNTPLAQLAANYQSSMQLHYLSLLDITLLVISSALLGIIGAWLSVTRYLRSLRR